MIDCGIEEAGAGREVSGAAQTRPTTSDASAIADRPHPRRLGRDGAAAPVARQWPARPARHRAGRVARPGARGRRATAEKSLGGRCAWSVRCWTWLAPKRRPTARPAGYPVAGRRDECQTRRLLRNRVRSTCCRSCGRITRPLTMRSTGWRSRRRAMTSAGSRRSWSGRFGGSHAKTRATYGSGLATGGGCRSRCSAGSFARRRAVSSARRRLRRGGAGVRGGPETAATRRAWQRRWLLSESATGSIFRLEKGSQSMSVPTSTWRPDEDIEEILIDRGARSLGGWPSLASRSPSDYQGKRLLLLGVLKGAVHVPGGSGAADPAPLEIDFMAISSYGASTQVERHRPHPEGS